MEDTIVYDKVNLIDRYDLTCVKNELELKINNIDERVENIEETFSDHIVEFTVFKKDICEDIVNRGFEINDVERKLESTDKKINEIQKYLHLNIMCLDDDIKKLKLEFEQRERIYIMIIGFIFCLYLLFTHLQLLYSP